MSYTIYTYTCPHTHINISRDNEGAWSWLIAKDTGDKVFGENRPADRRLYYVEMGRVLQVLLERCQKSFGEEQRSVTMTKIRN